MFQKTGSLYSLMAVFGPCGNVHGVASRVGGACGAVVEVELSVCDVWW